MAALGLPTAFAARRGAARGGGRPGDCRARTLQALREGWMAQGVVLVQAVGQGEAGLPAVRGRAEARGRGGAAVAAAERGVAAGPGRAPGRGAGGRVARDRPAAARRAGEVGGAPRRPREPFRRRAGRGRGLQRPAASRPPRSWRSTPPATPPPRTTPTTTPPRCARPAPSRARAARSMDAGGRPAPDPARVQPPTRSCGSRSRACSRARAGAARAQDARGGAAAAGGLPGAGARRGRQLKAIRQDLTVQHAHRTRSRPRRTARTRGSRSSTATCPSTRCAESQLLALAAAARAPAEGGGASRGAADGRPVGSRARASGLRAAVRAVHDDRAELRAELARAARDERAGAARGGAAAVARERVALRLGAGDYVGFFREYRAAALAARSVTDADSGGGDGGGGGGGGAAPPPPPRVRFAGPSRAQHADLLDFLVARVRGQARARRDRARQPLHAAAECAPPRAAPGFADEASCARFLRGARARHSSATPSTAARPARLRPRTTRAPWRWRGRVARAELRSLLERRGVRSGAGCSAE